MSTSPVLDYRGKQISVGSGREIYEAMQLLATDLGAGLNSIAGLAKDMRATIERDNNRDGWLKKFFDWSVPILNRGSSTPSPVGLLGLFNPNVALPAALPTTPTTPPTPPPTPAKSPHRTAPLPTVAILHPGCAVSITGHDRGHQITIEFTAPYSGTTGVCEVTYGTSYTDLPIVVGNQVGSDTRVDSWVTSYTSTGYRIDCEAVTAGIVKWNAIVVPRNDEDFD